MQLSKRFGDTELFIAFFREERSQILGIFVGEKKPFPIKESLSKPKQEDFIC